MRGKTPQEKRDFLGNYILAPPRRDRGVMYSGHCQAGIGPAPKETGSESAVKMERQMTKHQAQTAMDRHQKVEAGVGTADHDRGYIRSINGTMAQVGWDSGVVTPCPLADLSLAD